MTLNWKAIVGALGIAGIVSQMQNAQAAVTSVSSPVSGMTTSQRGIAFIKHEEGFRPRVYPDAGRNAIGFGHQLVPGDGLSVQSVITEEQAARLLVDDLAKFERKIKSAVRVPLSQGQFDALASLTYNLGDPSAYPTLLQKLNTGDYAGARAAFDLYNKSQGKVNATLVGRRQREANLFASY